MLKVKIVKEIRKNKKRKDVTVFNLLAPINENNPILKIVATNLLSSSYLYSYATIHCKRLGLDYFYDEDEKITLSSLKDKKTKIDENTQTDFY